MGTVDHKHDYVLSWRRDENIEGVHNHAPVYLSEYVQALEALLRAGDCNGEDLERLRSRMGILPDAGRPRPIAPTSNSAGDAVNGMVSEAFRTHRWVGWELRSNATCIACSVTSDMPEALQDCEFKL